MKISFSINKKHRDKRVAHPSDYSCGFVPAQGGIEELAAAIQAGHAWSGSIYRENYRHSKNFIEGQVIALDIDNAPGSPQMPLAIALQDPFLQKAGAFIYTSPSHQREKEGSPAADRFRVVFIAPTPLDSQKFRALVLRLMALYPAADPACKDPTRYWCGNSQGELFFLGGAFLPTSWVSQAIAEEDAKKEREKRETAARRDLFNQNFDLRDPKDQKARILEALEFIPARQPGTGTYQESLVVVMALASYFPAEEAAIIADAWSPPQQGWDAGAKIRKGDFRGDITIASLFWIAKQYGWRPPAFSGNPFRAIKAKPRRAGFAAPPESDPRQESKKAKASASYEKARRVDFWKEVFGERKYLVDFSGTGGGKTYAAGLLEPFEGGRIWYLSRDHRNPSTETIEDNFCDMPSRHNGLGIDYSKKTAGGFPHLVRDESIEERTESNCHFAAHFLELAEKNIEGGSEICSACPFSQKCKKESGAGYGFKRQRQAAFFSKKIRIHPLALPSPESYDYKKDIVVIEEAGMLSPIVESIFCWEDFSSQFDYLEFDAPDIYGHIQPLKRQMKAVFEAGGRVGNDEIAAQLKAGIEGANWLEVAYQIEVKMGELLAAKIEAEGVAEGVGGVVPDPLSLLLKALAGDGILRLSGKALSIKKLDTRLPAVCAAAKNVLLLDATAHPERIAAMIGCKSEELYFIAQEEQGPKNLELIGIESPGFGSNQHSPDARKRANHLIEELKKRHPGLKICGWSRDLEASDHSISIDLNWLGDSRGSNQYQGSPAMVGVGLPFLNLGALQDEYRLVAGGLEDFDSYYSYHVAIEIRQALGRMRSNLYPGKSFCFYLIGSGLDREWLQFICENAKVIPAGEISPLGEKGAARDRQRAIECGRELLQKGVRLTQQALAGMMGCTQGWISRLFRGFSWAQFLELVNAASNPLPEEADASEAAEALLLSPTDFLEFLGCLLDSSGWGEIELFFRRIRPDLAWRGLGIIGAWFIPVPI